MNKTCKECGVSLVGLTNIGRRVFCGEACRVEGLKFSVKHADEMFWPKVAKKGPKDCWPYYRTDAAGYGRLLRSGPYVYAHRVAWMLTKGTIPDGMEVAHACDVRNCCNPAHLFLATHDENVADMVKKGRNPRGERSKRNKITEVKARAILALKPLRYPRKTPGLAKDLAAKNGILPGAVHAIWRGDAWKHLDRSSGDQEP